MMKQENNKRANYSLFTYFFWWCSGAVIPILEKHSTEKNKYVGMGAAIFGTWMLATFSGVFAFKTIFKSLVIAIPVGVVYGLIIFNLDRFITSSMRKIGSEDEVFLMTERVQNFFYYELMPAFPRFLIAILIGLAISKPLEIKLFETEIQKQLDKDYQTNVYNYEQLLFENSKRKKGELRGQLAELESRKAKKQHYIDNKIDTLNQEILGKRGRGYVGYGIRAKKLNELIEEAKEEKSELKAEIELLKYELKGIDAEANNSIEEHKREQKEKIGFFDQIEALSNLIEDPKNKPIWWSNFLIICLIILIETAPILVKLISVRGPYDAELEWQNKKIMIQRDREVREMKFRRRSGGG